MTTRRPRSSERTTFRGLRCLQTPFGQALAANGREHPTPGRGRGNQYDVIRSGCPEQTCLPRTTPAALAPTAAPEDPPWHVLSACAETAPFHQPHDSHTDMPVAHQPTSPAAIWLFVAESLRKLPIEAKKGPRMILCGARGTGGRIHEGPLVLVRFRTTRRSFSYMPRNLMSPQSPALGPWMLRNIQRLRTAVGV